MISVRNHRRRLNGNRIGGFLILCLVLFSQCRTQSVLVNPDTEKDIEDQETEVIAVDTIEWEKEVVEEKETFPDDGIIKIDDDSKEVRKNIIQHTDIALLLPMELAGMSFGSERIDRRDELMLHYVMGVRLAMEKLKREEDLDLNIYIEDAYKDNLDYKLREIKSKDVSFIFGGRGRKDVEKIAEFAREEEIYYCSIWQTNSSFVQSNDYYIQMNPGLQAHLLTILQDVLPEYGREQIVLFGSEKERSRIEELNRMYKLMTGDRQDLTSIVVDSVQELEEYELLEYQERDSQTVFIVPLTRNYNMIHDFFRVLEMNELQDKSIVYGVTEWREEKLIPLINNYDVRLTSFFDHVIDSKYISFEEQFFSRMGTLPEHIAYEGYNHALLMAEMIKALNSGDDILELEVEAPGVKLELVDHAHLVDPQLDKGDIQTTYLENRSLFVIGYENFRYFRLK